MFEKLFETAYDVVTLPASVAADVVTIGGALVDRDEPYTVEKGSRIIKNAVKVAEDMAK